MLRPRRGHGRGREGGGTVSVKLQTIDWSWWLLSQSANADIEIRNSLKKKRRRRRRGQRVPKDLRTGVEDVVHMYLRVAPDTQRSLQVVRRHFLQWSNASDFEHGLAGTGRICHFANAWHARMALDSAILGEGIVPWRSPTIGWRGLGERRVTADKVSLIEGRDLALCEDCCV